MARCQVTVEGRTLEVEASSLYYAAIEYNHAQVCGFARTYPRLSMDTVLEVQSEGKTEIHRITWRQVLDWANRKGGQSPP